MLTLTFLNYRKTFAMIRNTLLVIIGLIFAELSLAQDFYFGDDLSYVNMMEDCGAAFKEDGVEKDVYKIYADNGHNLVRLRLWVDPAWQNEIPQPEGVKNEYSNLEDVFEGIQRSKAAGMQVLLDFHYSDFWADPNRQAVPKRWAAIASNVKELSDSVYSYTFNVLTKLDNLGLMPELVQVGNENNPGMLVHSTIGTVENDFEVGGVALGGWNRQARLFNAGIKAVRDVSKQSAIKTKVVLHYAGVGEELRDWYENITEHGITDYDIIGMSYYFAWHGSSIPEVGEDIEYLHKTYPNKEIVILETGYPWTDGFSDNNGNIITAADSNYVPLTPGMQRTYLVDLSKEVMDSGGNGVIFWESAWVSTECRTPWGKGSSHEHVAFFDWENHNFIENGGGDWPNPKHYND